MNSKLLKEIEKLVSKMSDKNLNKALSTICGRQLGAGITRDVFILKQNSRYVVKFERIPEEKRFSNVLEYFNWANCSGWNELDQWLAPCEWINDNGQILIQRRVYHHDKRKYPDKIPALFTDLKTANFGWIGDRFVCCDYPFFLINRHSLRLKKADWWNLDYINNEN